jgi:hypothetical protein
MTELSSLPWEALQSLAQVVLQPYTKNQIFGTKEDSA